MLPLGTSMVYGKSGTWWPPTPLFLFSGHDPRLSDGSKVQRPDDEGSRMGDEGCPNESPSVEDATGYSQEEEKAFSEEQAAVSSR